MGKSTISMAIFNGYVQLPEGIRMNSNFYFSHFWWKKQFDANRVYFFDA